MEEQKIWERRDVWTWEEWWEERLQMECIIYERRIKRKFEDFSGK